MICSLSPAHNEVSYIFFRVEHCIKHNNYRGTTDVLDENKNRQKTSYVAIFRTSHSLDSFIITKNKNSYFYELNVSAFTFLININTFRLVVSFKLNIYTDPLWNKNIRAEESHACTIVLYSFKAHKKTN